MTNRRDFLKHGLAFGAGSFLLGMPSDLLAKNDLIKLTILFRTMTQNIPDLAVQPEERH
jgi:hypothetical protein